MNTYFVINLEDFKLKKDHPYTIYFTATCPVFNHGTFDLEYTGPDLEYTVSLPSDYMDLVCKEMQDVFGYGPFDKSKVKQAMREQHQFRINQCDKRNLWWNCAAIIIRSVCIYHVFFNDGYR